MKPWERAFPWITDHSSLSPETEHPRARSKPQRWPGAAARRGFLTDTLRLPLSWVQAAADRTDIQGNQSLKGGKGGLKITIKNHHIRGNVFELISWPPDFCSADNNRGHLAFCPMWQCWIYSLIAPACETRGRHIHLPTMIYVCDTLALFFLPQKLCIVLCSRHQNVMP